MVEYVIEIVANGDVVALVHTERDGRHTFLRPSLTSYSHVTKYRVRSRAETVAAKYPLARLAGTFGGYVYGTKSTVVPVQPKINRRSAYRSI